MTNILQSATRLTFVILISVLSLVVLYATARYDLFGPDMYKVILAAYIGITTNAATYFYAKSTMENMLPKIASDKQEAPAEQTTDEKLKAALLSE